MECDHHRLHAGVHLPDGADPGDHAVVLLIRRLPDLSAAGPFLPLVRRLHQFAALDDDLARFERGEKKLEQLLIERPKERPALLAWQGGALLYRASLASKAGKQDELVRLYEKAIATFEEAVKEAEFRDREVFVFRDHQGKVKVLHRKKDGKMELIEAP